MTTASISALKANLSRYLREVRRGNEVEVLNRGAPVARLVPPAAGDDEEVRRRLIGAGLRPGKGCAAALLDTEPLALPVRLSEALADDRASRIEGGKLQRWMRRKTPPSSAMTRTPRN